MRPCSPAVVVLLSACGPVEMAATDTTSTTSTSTGDSSTSQVDADTTAVTPTTGDMLDPCECADPVVVEGDLYVPGLDGFQGFCIAEITGRLRIEDVEDPDALEPLAHLRRADSLWIRDNPGITDLSALGCLEQIHDGLQIYDNPALTDLGGLGRLQTARTVLLGDLPIATLPGFAPGFHGLELLALEDLPALVDLAPLAGWSSTLGTTEVNVRLSNLPLLTSVAPLAGPLGPPGTPDAVASLDFSGLPALTSLTGLEAVTRGDILFTRLPKVSSLAPLAGLTQAGLLHLVGMTSLTSLQGLNDLQTAQNLRLGGCEPHDRLPGLIDLTGLDSLTQVGEALEILGNPNLVALTGAPMLSTAAFIDIVDNPKLGADAVAAFEAQVIHKELCAGSMVDCGCLGAYPEAVNEGCANAWSGGSAVIASGKAGALDGTTAFFGHQSFADERWLILVVLDAAADIPTAIDDGTYYDSDAGTPKLVFENQQLYPDWIGVSTAYAELSQPGGLETSFPVQVTVTGRLGNWLMSDPADPPRLVGEFTTTDPGATTKIQGPFDAAFCEAFTSQIND